MGEGKRINWKIVRVLLISTVVNRSLKKAIEDVRDYTNVKLVYTRGLQNYSIEDFQQLVDWADVVLIDVRGDPVLLADVDYRGKDVVYLVGGSPTLMAKAKLGKFKMPVKAGAMTMRSPETLKKRIERIQKIIEGLGKVIPFGILRDGRDYVRLLKYWGNGGYENYKNMFLLLAKRAGADVEVKEPIEFPEHGIYHPIYGFNYKPVIDPSKPTVGILFYGGMHFEQCIKTLERIIEKIDANIIPVYTEGILGLKAVEEYFANVDAIISLLWFRLNGGPLGGDPRPTIELLKKRKAKLFTPALMFTQEIDDWERDERGLNIVQTITTVLLPEMDGGVEPIPICGVRNDEVIPIEDRVDKFARRVNKWLELRRKPNSDKRIAIIVYNYPPGEENLCNAAYLDTFKSVERIIEELEKEGYKVKKADLKKLFLERKLFNPKLYPPEKIGCSRMSTEEYLRYFNELPEDVRRDVVKFWGEPPGEIMVDNKGILIPGVVLGNVFIGVQSSRPPLTSEEDLYSAIHDKTKPPHHQYLAFYFWVEKVFNADCVIHVGTHGTAEFMKGKEIGLSFKCFPDILIGNIPHLYIYHVVNTSEATIAKRRLYGTLISYNSPPYTASDLYEDYAELEEYLDEYREASGKDMARAEIAKRKALELAKKLHLGENLDEVEAKLYEYKRSIIPKGLHVLGQKYSLEELKDFIVLLARYDRGEIKSLNRLICETKSWSYDEVLRDPRRLREVDREARRIIKRFLRGEKVPPRYERTLRYCLETAKMFADNSLEIKNLLEGLKGNYVEPSVGGDVIRNPEALPTGRNLYQFDPLKVPIEAATERGRYIARETLRKYFEKYGRYPESVGVVLWGFETAKTYGETIAQIFEHLGVEVVHKTPWEKELRVIPLDKLGHPRIDVVVTICGFFREMFPNVVELIDKAVRLVSELNEPEEANFVRKYVRELEKEFGDLAKVRIFGPRATEYGTRMLQLVEDSIWRDENDLAEAYISSMCYAYGRGIYSQEARGVFENLLKSVGMVSQVRDSHDYEITDLDHYYEFFGGLSKTVEILRGRKPEMLIADTTREVVKVEDVRDSIRRGTITRTLNPKWIEGMLKHGFLGVQKIADRVEYLLGLAATTGAVENWIWDRVAERFVLDEDVFERLKNANPYATKEILERLLEANKRDYWDADKKVLDKIEEKYIELDAMLEEEV